MAALLALGVVGALGAPAAALQGGRHHEGGDERSRCYHGQEGGKEDTPCTAEDDSDRLICIIRSLPFHCDPKPPH